MASNDMSLQSFVPWIEFVKGTSIAIGPIEFSQIGSRFKACEAKDGSLAFKLINCGEAVDKLVDVPFSGQHLHGLKREASPVNNAAAGPAKKQKQVAVRRSRRLAKQNSSQQAQRGGQFANEPEPPSGLSKGRRARWRKRMRNMSTNDTALHIKTEDENSNSKPWSHFATAGAPQVRAEAGQGIIEPAARPIGPNDRPNIHPSRLRMLGLGTNDTQIEVQQPSSSSAFAGPPKAPASQTQPLSSSSRTQFHWASTNRSQFGQKFPESWATRNWNKQGWLPATGGSPFRYAIAKHKEIGEATPAAIASMIDEVADTARRSPSGLRSGSEEGEVVEPEPRTTPSSMTGAKHLSVFTPG